MAIDRSVPVYDDLREKIALALRDKDDQKGPGMLKQNLVRRLRYDNMIDWQSPREHRCVTKFVTVSVFPVRNQEL